MGLNWFKTEAFDAIAKFTNAWELQLPDAHSLSLKVKVTLALVMKISPKLKLQAVDSIHAWLPNFSQACGTKKKIYGI